MGYFNKNLFNKETDEFYRKNRLMVSERATFYRKTLSDLKENSEFLNYSLENILILAKNGPYVSEQLFEHIR